MKAKRSVRVPEPGDVELLISVIRQRLGLPRWKARLAIKALFGSIKEGLGAGKRVVLQGVGTLKVKTGKSGSFYSAALDEQVRYKYPKQVTLTPSRGQKKAKQASRNPRPARKNARKVPRKIVRYPLGSAYLTGNATIDWARMLHFENRIKSDLAKRSKGLPGYLRA